MGEDVAEGSDSTGNVGAPQRAATVHFVMNERLRVCSKCVIASMLFLRLQFCSHGLDLRGVGIRSLPFHLIVALDGQMPINAHAKSINAHTNVKRESRQEDKHKIDASAYSFG